MGMDGRPGKIVQDEFLISSWGSHEISFFIDFKNDSINMTKDDQQNAFLTAFKVWEEQTSLKFRQSAKKDAQIKGAHGDDFDFDGRGHTLAHAFYPGQKGRSGQVHLDADENWSLYGYHVGETSLLMVTLHEIGHALGLGHSLDPDSVMRPIYKGYSWANLKLGAKDIDGVEKLYGEDPSKFKNDGIFNSRRAFEDVDICGVVWDAVLTCRGETFFFSDRRMWRLSPTGHFVPPLAMKIHEFWDGFPHNKPVDAAYERSTDGALIFFSDAKVYKFHGAMINESSPATIAEFFNLPPEIAVPKKIDAAIHWKMEQLTFLFFRSSFWKIDEFNVEKPQLLQIGKLSESIWKELPSNMDAAFVDSLEVTHFIKRRKTWEFNKIELKERLRSENVAEKWFHCPKKAVFLDAELTSSGKREIKEDNEESGILSWFRPNSSLILGASVLLHFFAAVAFYL
ncbi:Oidioi.mRNA.OKI2018_I69.XSR.g15832.t1.cds [Oikopleura dioica]|uniref:Oidioi.mRNA.OKI2018_I69.XSR.g15832.t1.cds n=1 Tax=Oikopleura dioica TaxID=34765 RepID=A0ABN7SKG5_OIKDI|nr:Oidioi.mRNA.OKI2018_I69.XSR.g15832.t1.cds [Oikopleura dioica]